MFIWSEFETEVKSRLGADSINPNTEVQSLITSSIVDGVIDLQEKIAALREDHVSSYSPSTGVMEMPSCAKFSLPTGIRRVNHFFYKQALLADECSEWFDGFFVDGFLALGAAEGYYQKTGVSDPLEGIDEFEVGPTWFANDATYVFRIVKHADGNYYPALFELTGADPLADPETPLPAEEILYLSNPLTVETDEGPAYAPWLSDGVAVWKMSVDDTVVVVPSPNVGTTYKKKATTLDFTPWVEFQNSSESLTWSSATPGIGSFTVRGPFPSRHDRICLNWSGVKQSFEADDETPFDVRCARAVSFYVKNELVAGHKEKRLQAQAFERKWMETRRDLYLSYKDVGDTM